LNAGKAVAVPVKLVVTDLQPAVVLDLTMSNKERRKDSPAVNPLILIF
jgi:hypothetical protein